MSSHKKTVSCKQAREFCPELILESLGDENITFKGISALENIQADSFVFLTQKKYLDQVKSSSATMVIAPVSWKAELGDINSSQCWLLSPNPELAMVKIKQNCVLSTPYQSSAYEGAHSTACIHESAQIGENVTIGPGAYIGSCVTIGNHCFIGANAIVEDHVKIGAYTTLHPLSYIGHNCIIGQNCEILPQACVGSEGYGYAHDEKWNHYRIPHSGRVVLEDDVHIGANSSIDRGNIEDTIIKKGTKIDNQCHLAHNSIVGENSLLTAQFGMAGSSKLGKNFVTGGKTSVTGHIEITDNVQVAGMSGVTKSITKPGQYGGFPLQPLQQYLKTKAAISQLADLRKAISKLIKND